ncbi:MAG: hypothetical protein V4568_14535 [Pseudomonadota bacterium]
MRVNTANKKVEKETIIVKQAEEPIAVEILAQSIADIGAAMKKLGASRLKRYALVVLLSDSTRLSKSRVEAVLNAMDRLEDMYLKPVVRK